MCQEEVFSPIWPMAAPYPMLYPRIQWKEFSVAWFMHTAQSSRFGVRLIL